MLSRAAENMYWMARHLERLENTARLIAVTSEARLDWPGSADAAWRTVLVVTGALRDLEARGLGCTDQEAADLLIGDARCASSILSLSALARENNRALIELLPRESWEEVNALHQLAGRPGAAEPRLRDEHLREVVGRAQAMAGLFMGALNDDEGYAFLRLGRAIERGDFAARVLLGALESVGDGLADSQALGAADWVGVLQSLTAFQMYRRSVQGPVTGPRVIRFLMCSTVFPRAVACCAKEATLALARLPASGPLAAAAVQLSSGLASECLSDSHEGDGTGVITISQSRLLDLHGMIAATYFPSGWDPPLMAGQTQAQFASAQGQKEVAPSRC